MKLAVLYSGGKDSNYALYEASKKHQISCLINIVSRNTESYMFQSIGNQFTKYQAEALEIPLISKETLGEKEKELQDLKDAIIEAIKKYKIEGIVTGAIKSVYQASRIQKICDELDIWCFNPLWQKDENSFVKELIDNKFDVIIIGIASYPLEKKHLGIKLNEENLNQLLELSEKYKFNIAGEGGEYESFVLDSPMFKKRLVITDLDIEYENNFGNIILKEIELIPK